MIFWAAALLPVAGAAAQAKLTAEQQKQAQGIYNEHQAMQIAMKAHQKCKGLDTLTFVAAAITADLRKTALVQMNALTDSQVANARGAAQKEIDAEKCDTLKAKPVLKSYNERAIFYRDFYLYIWHEYMEVAALQIIMGKGSLAENKTGFGCGKHSYDQIRAIKPYTDKAHQAMKTKGQYKNARAQAEEMIKNCQAKLPGVAASPLMQMLEAAQGELKKKS